MIVDMLKSYFPLTIDKLDRENALFEGPHPLLLGGLTADDLCILLSGSDRHQSQVSGHTRPSGIILHLPVTVCVRVQA